MIQGRRAPGASRRKLLLPVMETHADEVAAEHQLHCRDSTRDVVLGLSQAGAMSLGTAGDWTFPMSWLGPR